MRWALEPAAGVRVLDLGAGTGKLTATLVAVGADVTAVEPDPAMLAELRGELPDVRALPGRAEAIPLPDASVDAVVALLATRAGMLVMPEQERTVTLERIRAYLARTPETADGEFTLPMLTRVLRVTS
ncbi:class I SAM-dependent methyltransferase [Amycolatopsis sp. NPDC048633]|uniref:class I SAM-dependent methyltransferase n=1 Tax=Amycolatopsis sp. NPDC048633 TaxID=3157095 RepID=UPI0033F78902